MDFEISLLDLNVGMNVTPDGELDVRVVANADLYEPGPSGSSPMPSNTAFDAFATTPDCPVSALELLPAADLEKLLAPPSPADAERSQPVAGGSAETEQALIALLEELLDITGVDREDNFFALGGDSIISVQLVGPGHRAGTGLDPGNGVRAHDHRRAGRGGRRSRRSRLRPRRIRRRCSEAAPMSASGLGADALAELTASWLSES